MCERVRYRVNLERAIFEAGYETDEEFGRAVGASGGTVKSWLLCRTSPVGPYRSAIARVLEISPGADCDEVRDADLDWLLEPCDVLRM